MFEYDPKKNIANKVKHGINFEEAQVLWEDENRVIFLTNYLDEKRELLTGMAGAQIWTTVYTIRDRNIRIISVRRARKHEKEIYNSRGI